MVAQRSTTTGRAASRARRPTAWVPQSKPFWLMEIGCPAVDKGANQPNVFVDPKSSESALPYFSRGTRDDLMQRRYLRAFIEAFDPASRRLCRRTPIRCRSLTDARMVDLDHIHVYTWDARPYPAFPTQHRRVGRRRQLAARALAQRALRPPRRWPRRWTQLLDDYGFADHETGALNGTVPGFVIDRVMSPRDALQPLELAYFFDSVESGGRIVFRHRGAEPPVLSLDGGRSGRGARGRRAADADARRRRPSCRRRPRSPTSRARATIARRSRRRAGLRARAGASAQAELPLVLDFERASEIAESWLFEAWASRERAELQAAAVGARGRARRCG